MRRRVVPLVLLVVSTLLGTLPASAEDPEPPRRVEIWRGTQNGGLPSDLAFRSRVCATPSEVGGDPYYFFSDDALVAHPGHERTAELAHTVSSLDALTTYRLALRTWIPGHRELRVEIPGTGVVGTGEVWGAGIRDWSEIDVLAQPDLSWGGPTGSLGRSTVDAFRRAHPELTDRPAVVVVGSRGCQGDLAGGFAVDDLEVGTRAASRVIDFRGLRTPELVGTTTSFVIPLGTSVSLRAQISNSGEPGLGGAPVQLWARTSGSNRDHLVATVPSAADGTASATVRPMRRTVYRWRYGSLTDRPYSWSEKSVTVRVSTIVGLRLHRSARGRDVAVVRATPAQRQRVTIRQVRSGGRWGARLGTGRVGPDGLARIRLTPRKPGVQRIVAVVGSAPGVDGWHSRSLKVRLRP